MLGQLYDRALDGERCWLRHDDGRLHRLPVHSWFGHSSDQTFDTAVVELCDGPTIDLGCGPGRLVSHLIRRGIPALGVDQSATAVRLARRNGAPALLRDVFDPLPATGRWRTVLLADGNVGLAGDPLRVLRRAAELMCRGGRCVVEFDPGWPVCAAAGCGWSPPAVWGPGFAGRRSGQTVRPRWPMRSVWHWRRFTRSATVSWLHSR